MVVRAVPRTVYRWRQILAAIAICGLLAPLLTPAMPALAAWTPDHDHLSIGGVDVPHSHPWDEAEPASTPSAVLHFCAIHPDGRVADAATSEQAAAAGATASSETADVVFLFDPDVTGSVLLPPSAPALSCAGVTAVAPMAAVTRPVSAVTRVPIPPPKSLHFSAA